MMMTLEEYVASFGWRIEDCTPEELEEAKKELLELNQNNASILDGVLAFKMFSVLDDPKNEDSIYFDRNIER